MSRTPAFSLPLLLAAASLLAPPGAFGAEPKATPPAKASAAAPAASPSTAKDPEAMALLKRMCDRLQAAKSFTAKGRASLELPVPTGTLGTFFNDFDLSVRRPNALAAIRTGDLPKFRFAYDGKTMTVHTPDTGTWGSTAAPATLDAMLVAAGEQGDLSLPFDELVVADPWAAVTAGVTEAVRAGPATIQGKKVEHLVLSGATLLVEYWIDPATALPARSVAVYLDHPLRPHFVVEFAEWKIDPKLPDTTFALPMPQGAKKVDFREAASTYR